MQLLNKKINTCIITAGGKGSRLKEITGDIPKPLFHIKGKSCLERSIELLIEADIRNIIILTSYKADLFEEKINEYKSKYNILISIKQETIPMGECGGLWELRDEIIGNILFLNGDLVWDIDLYRFINFHNEHDCDITLLTHLCTHPLDSDIISEKPTKEIESYSLKPHKDTNNIWKMYLGNAGIAIIKVNSLFKLPPPINQDSLCHHILKNMSLYKIRVFSYNTSEYVKDMGTPKRLEQVKKALDNEIVFKKSYKRKQKCLFLDRDNTLIKCQPEEYIIHKNQVILLKRNIEIISDIAKDYDLIIMATNQPQISMGLITWKDVMEINSFILQECLKLNLKIDSFSICPHHSHSGFPNENISLKQDCFCRKPKPGLLIQESFYKNIDLSRSMMIGDSINDETAAKRAGTSYIDINKLNKTIL